MVKNAFVDFDDKHNGVRAYTTQRTMVVVSSLEWPPFLTVKQVFQAKDHVVPMMAKLHYYAPKQVIWDEMSLRQIVAQAESVITSMLMVTL